ncbi:hypothetical protein C5167_019613 [Papaver somniferum]|uniref:Uncharacterized protein n=1 Tax=Papaver somniferum TaxID=3469 RepID=A0A4Y7IQN9_PAPSO|nr:hypothetical protein C5167_019613 [Papaver somniferum]
MQRRNHNFNVVLILISYLILKILEFVFKKSKEKWTKLWMFRLSTSDELDVPTFGDKPVMEIAKQHGGYQLQVSLFSFWVLGETENARNAIGAKTNMSKRSSFGNTSVDDAVCTTGETGCNSDEIHSL